MPPRSKGHILFINRVFPPDAGASGLRLSEMCQGLAERGWRITVLTNRGRNVAPIDMHANITVVRLPFGNVDKKPGAFTYMLWLVALLCRALTLPRADITVTLTDPPMSVVVSAVLGLFKQTRTVHWVHDLYPHLFRVMKLRVAFLLPVLNVVSRWAMNRHDKIVAIGRDMAGLIGPDLRDAAKIAVIPNWPDVASSWMDIKKPTRKDSENPFILEGVFTVLYSGNFGLVHDFQSIIDAIQIVHRSPHPIRFIFAGDGRRFNAVRNAVDKLTLTNVHFIRAQPRDKFIEMLLAGDLHLATMRPSAAGMVAPSKINSALGLGRPVIYLGSPHSSQAQLITDYDAGAVIDANDPQAKVHIAAAIIDYATLAQRYETAQANARKAAESISYQHAVDAFDALFAQLHPEL